MKKIERQIALDASGLHIREAQAEGETSRVMEGYSALFGVKSLNLSHWSNYREIYEVLEPGCITEETIKNSDVVLTSYHNNENLMGRSRMGAGTLKLSVDEKGLKVVCDLPKTKAADDAIELIQRGDLAGMSFAYSTDEGDSENCVSYERVEPGENGKEIWIRHVKKVTNLYDVTIACRPAYPSTEVGLRDQDQAAGIEAHVEEMARQEREEQAKAYIQNRREHLKKMILRNL